MSASQYVFQGTRFSVKTQKVKTHGGHEVQKEVVIHPGAVAILAFLDKENILLIRNERFAVGEWLWELPAGTREPKEEAIVTASRELIEETGYEASKVIPLLDFYTAPGFCTEKLFSYVAYDLKHVGQKLEETEKIQVEIVPFSKALDMIEKGTIHDAKTIATILYYHAFKNQRS